MRYLLRGLLIAWIVLAGCSEDSSSKDRALVDAGFVDEISTSPDAETADTTAAEASSDADREASTDSGTDTTVAPDVDSDSDPDSPG